MRSHLCASLITLVLAGTLAGCGSAPVASSPGVTPITEARVAPARSSAGSAGSEENTVTNASGLTYVELVPGTGEAPKAGDVVSVNYRGILKDGTIFDNSYDRGEPITFPLGKQMVIAGWDEGIALMRVGGKARLIVPPNLAYGARGYPPVIPPNATLTFEVELMGIQPGPPEAPTKLEAAQYTTTGSGLKYYDLELGKGTEASVGKSAIVHYTGWLTNGTMFDSSLSSGETFVFQVGAGEVIKGWDEGVQGMRVGGRRQLLVPANLGYGARSVGGVIPPNATLIFEVELIDVK
jgi:peptidylprolyl isomerase